MRRVTGRGALRYFALDNVLLGLLLAAPVALAMQWVFGLSGTPVFVASAVAIIPLAGYMGRATERLSDHLGAGWGGFLNATFGNAAELIIAIVALRAGLMDVVKASITGSIIGNILMVLGFSVLVGGLRFPMQRFNRTAASLGATMLVLAAIGLVIPTIFHEIVGDSAPGRERGLSLDIAVVLMTTYLLGLIFSFRTHSHLYLGTGAAMDHGKLSDPEQVPGGAPRALGLLLLSAASVGVMSELMVGALEEAAHDLGMNRIFVGVILVALVGNAAEHSTAVLMAARNKMDLAVNIAVGSSIQIAMFVAPLLLFLSYFIGPGPMDLHFTTLEVVSVVLSVGIMALVSLDGESHWMEGIQLLAVYVMLGLAFYFLPA
jgi:Ca2+:H+ antiporter